MTEDLVTKAIAVAIRQVLDRYRSVDYGKKIDALIRNLTDIVGREEGLTKRETYARITAHFAEGPLETPETPEKPVTAINSQVNGATVGAQFPDKSRSHGTTLKPSRQRTQMAGKRADYARRQELVRQRSKKSEEPGS